MGERYETVAATDATCRMLRPDGGLDDDHLDDDHGLALGDPMGTALLVTGTDAEILAFLDRASAALTSADQPIDLDLDDLDLEILNDLDTHAPASPREIGSGTADEHRPARWCERSNS